MALPTPTGAPPRTQRRRGLSPPFTHFRRFPTRKAAGGPAPLPPGREPHPPLWRDRKSRCLRRGPRAPGWTGRKPQDLLVAETSSRFTPSPSAQAKADQALQVQVVRPVGAPAGPGGGAPRRVADGDGMNRHPECARSRLLEGRNPQVKNRPCKQVCKPNAAGQAETGETRKAGDDFAAQVCRGQRCERRLPETAETPVVRLITQCCVGVCDSCIWLMTMARRHGCRVSRRS